MGQKGTRNIRREFLKTLGLTSAGLLLSKTSQAAKARPNIILIMTDDQGWGQTGYYNHPALKTPNLDAMAANGLRFDRFYAGAPVCSPTRASVLTGRSNDRTGVYDHGYPLRLQEKTLPAALQAAGYATGHFGKWHLNGLRGPGAPIFAEDTHNPGAFGFDEWLSATNYIDRNPILSRNGNFEEFTGDSSAIIVDEALKFIRTTSKNNQPFFSVIWDGSPHSPWVASESDRKPFHNLPDDSQHHYGELVAFDRSVGVLRGGLRELGVADNTLVWYCSDNGGLPNHTPDTVCGLRGYKSSVWEGGLRVPGIIEWPAEIQPRITGHPACTMDIFPTIVDLLQLSKTTMLDTVDGISLASLFSTKKEKRDTPIPFRHRGRGALVDNDYKIVTLDIEKDIFELYNLRDDPTESRDISGEQPVIFNRMKSALREWLASAAGSVEGKDYPGGKVDANQPERRFWTEDDRYRPYFEAWQERPEYAKRIQPLLKK